MTDRVRIPQGRGRGTWREWAGKIWVTCPDCCQNYALDHDVAADGSVTPSLDCPTTTCAWHVYAVLEGFSERKG